MVRGNGVRRKTPAAGPDFWYKNAILYAVDIKSFQDSNGDGIGDICGLIERLDYLSRLGITCLWLLPFYPSPLRDNGYDITDYTSVDARLGTLEDFIELVHRAGELGIRVITDLAMNHTSNRHPWFEAARRSPDSRYRHYYVWSDAPPSVQPGGENAFPGTEHSAWRYDEIAGAYYYHLFYHFQPDLNTANPDVLEEIRRFIHLWTAFDVSGFRLDAIGPMIGKRVRNSKSSEDPLHILNEIRQAMQERVPDGVLLGEADVPPPDLVNYFGKSGRLNMLMSFLLSQYLFLSFASERAEPLARLVSLLPCPPEDAQWVNFLRNLDELNCDKLTPEERALTIQAFGPDPAMQLYDRGVRRRVSPMLNGDPRRLRMAYSLLFSMRGSPMITFGDEIGMGDDLSLFERESVRTPMQWSADQDAGFSTAPPEELFRPVSSGGEFGYERVNVNAQEQDSDSLLNWMKRLTALRRQHPEIGWSQKTVETGHPAVFASLSEWQGRRLLTVHNLSSREAKSELLSSAKAKLILGDAATEPHGPVLHVHLEPYGFGWFELSAEEEPASNRSQNNGRVAVESANKRQVRKTTATASRRKAK